MPTKSLARDRARISSQKHEISYAGRKVSGGSAAIIRAKKTLGRKTGRKAVMAKAKAAR